MTASLQAHRTQPLAKGFQAAAVLDMLANLDLATSLDQPGKLGLVQMG